jgi:hypothetical protein
MRGWRAGWPDVLRNNRPTPSKNDPKRRSLGKI